MALFKINVAEHILLWYNLPKILREGEAMIERKIIVSNKINIKSRHKAIHDPYEYYKYKIEDDKKVNKLIAQIFEIPPHKANYPYHYHLNNDEVFYIISGQGILETPDGERKISPGDIIYCPTGKSGAHKLINTSDNEKLVYFECDTNLYPDVTYYPDSNKVGILSGDGDNTFYKTESNVNYYKDE